MLERGEALLPESVQSFASSDADPFYIAKAAGPTGAVHFLREAFITNPEWLKISEKTISKCIVKPNEWVKLPRKEMQAMKKMAKFAAEDSQIKKMRKLTKAQRASKKAHDTWRQRAVYEGKDQDGKQYFLSSTLR